MPERAKDVLAGADCGLSE